MSRLDRHISLVRGKLMLGQFFRGLAWSALALAAMVWTAIMVERLVQLHLPQQGTWLLAGFGLVALAGWGYSLWRRPSAKQAAVAIDERLALKEKFSTALYVRPMNDPFAVATVRDAEQTADNVSLHKRFSVEVPTRPLVLLAGAAIAILFTLALMPTFDLFRVEAARQKKIEVARHERAAAEKSLKEAIVQLDSAPKTVAESEQMKLARQDLSDALKHLPGTDPVAAQHKAESALQEMEALKQQIRDQAKFAEAKNEMRALASLPQNTDDKGPIAEARDAMSKGDLSQAVEKLTSAVENFQQKPPEEQKKTAQDMAKLAQQIAKNANDPQVQQNIQKQLQQMGATAQQAQAMAQQMQAAANGDKNAQQQIQKAANNLAQQMNQKQGGQSQSQQQQMAAQMQQAIQQMQSQANGQAQSQQMAQTAQQLAQAMQQAAQAQSGNQPGQQQQQQQGGQKGQSAQAQAQQQMQQSNKAMQQQLQQMQAMANAAQANGAGQQGQQGQQGQKPGQQPGQNPGQGQGQQGQQSGNGQGNQPGQQWAQGNNQQQGQGGGGGGQGGARPDPVEAPYGVKKELSQSETIDKGKILASSFVKAGTIVGESKVALSNAALKEEQDAADQVDEDRVPRASAQAVKNYFQTIKDDAK